MRITGGSARGINLTTGKAKQVRPATDRMREAVFSSLGDRIHSARFLDLFAGAGTYGLEALSRGAGSGLFVEKNAAATQALEENLRGVCKSMGIRPVEAAKIMRRDVLRFQTRDLFGIIFMDPPYELARTHGSALLKQIRPYLDPDSRSLVVYELPSDLEAPASGWNCLRRIGKSGTNEPSVLILEPTD